MKFSKLAASMPWGRQRSSVDMRMPGPVSVPSYYYFDRPPTTPSFVAAIPRDKSPRLVATTEKSMFAAPWKGSVIKPALRERLMYYSPKNMIARSPLVRNMPNSEQAADLRRFYATDEYARLSALAKPGTGTWRYGGPIERMVVNPGHVDGTPHVGVGVFGGQGMRDQVVGSLGLMASAITPAPAAKAYGPLNGPLRGRALGGFLKKLVGNGAVAANGINAYSSLADATKEVGTTPVGAIRSVSDAIDALPSTGVNVDAPKLKRGLSAVAVGEALRTKERGAIGTAVQSIAMPSVVGAEIAKKWVDNIGRRLVVDSAKPIKLPGELIRDLQTPGSDARALVGRVAGDIRLKDYSGLPDDIRRVRRAVPSLSDKYFSRDNGSLWRKRRGVHELIRDLQTPGSDAHTVADIAGDIGRKDHSWIADTFRRERHALSGLSDKYLPRDKGSLRRYARDGYDMLKKRGLKVNGPALLDDANRERRAVPSLSDKYFPRDGDIHERAHGRGAYVIVK